MASHHTLKVGTIISVGGLYGRIRRLEPSKRTTTGNDGEWYWCQIYVDKTKKLWKVLRKYMDLR